MLTVLQVYIVFNKREEYGCPNKD